MVLAIGTQTYYPRDNILFRGHSGSGPKAVVCLATFHISIWRCTKRTIHYSEVERCKERTGHYMKYEILVQRGGAVLDLVR